MGPSQERETQAHAGGQAERGVIQGPAQEPRAGRGKDGSSPRALRGSEALLTAGLGAWACGPRPENINFYCFKPPPHEHTLTLRGLSLDPQKEQGVTRASPQDLRGWRPPGPAQLRLPRPRAQASVPAPRRGGAGRGQPDGHPNTAVPQHSTARESLVTGGEACFPRPQGALARRSAGEGGSQHPHTRIPDPSVLSGVPPAAKTGGACGWLRWGHAGQPGPRTPRRLCRRSPGPSLLNEAQSREAMTGVLSRDDPKVLLPRPDPQRQRSSFVCAQRREQPP